jgi:hypothetical protein
LSDGRGELNGWQQRQYGECTGQWCNVRGPLFKCDRSSETWFWVAEALHSNRVSSNRCLCFRETEFYAQRQRRRNIRRSSQGLAGRDEAHANKSANWAVIARWPGNLFESRNAWWAREDFTTSIKSITCIKVGHLVIPWNHYVSYRECPTKFLHRDGKNSSLLVFTFSPDAYTQTVCENDQNP